MKPLLTLLTLIAMLFNAYSQNKIYNAEGKTSFDYEDIDIVFEDSGIIIPPKTGREFSPVLLSALPTAVDIVFKLTSAALENRVKQFTAEYSKQKSYLNAYSSKLPSFKLIRIVKLPGSEEEKVALEIIVKPFEVKKSKAFVYYVDEINLNYSEAKSSGENSRFDYVIDIKPTFMLNNEKKVLELSPLAISSVKYGKNKFPDKKHRTDIILLSEGSMLTEMSVKVIETNSCKVNAEKILSLWNDNKDSVKTIVNNFLPKEEKKDNDSEDEGKSGSSSTSATGSVGNE
jgi:hypothetical protein